MREAATGRHAVTAVSVLGAALDLPQVTSHTAVKPYGTKQTFSDSGDDLSITVSKARTVSGGDAGFDAALTGGSMSLVSYTQFALWDPDGHQCRANIFSSAIKSDQRMSLKMLSTSEPAATGKVLFEAPSGKDYSAFTLSWSDVSSEDHAAIAWNG